MDTLFPDAAALCVRPEFEKLLLNGNPLRPRQFLEEPRPGDAGAVRVYTADHIFRGLYRWDGDRKVFVPEKMFLET